jgi:hypothetical protein
VCRTEPSKSRVRGQDPQVEVEGRGGFAQLVQQFAARARDGDGEHGCTREVGHRREITAPTAHADAVDAPPPLRRVVVEDGDRRHLTCRVGDQAADELAATAPGTEDDDALGILARAGSSGA